MKLLRPASRIASPVTPSSASSRRSFLRELGGYASKGAAATLAAGPLASLAGCAAIVGEKTVEAFVFIEPVNGQFGGWTEISIDSPAGPDDSATLVRVALKAPRASRI
ncbi:MAG: hypothetical protein U0414_16320 [Polyangiaceae bacterium]